MKYKRTFCIAFACVSVLIASVMLSAEVVNSEAVILDADGKASIPVEIVTGLDSVAGIQGRILYDPAKVANISLSPSPDQAASFVIRSFVTEPGELKFLTYSKFRTLEKDKPVLYCNITAKLNGEQRKFNSVLICELQLAASPEALTHSETNSFVNLPVLGAPDTAVQQKWVLYSE